MDFAAPNSQEQFAAFRAHLGLQLVPTHIPGAFVSPETPAPNFEPQIGRSHHLQNVKRLSEASLTSNNWAGGVLQGSWVSATGSWVVPTVSKPTEAQGTEGGWNSASWVGLDGTFGSNDVLQAGIEQRVDASGNAKYVAWYEWWCDLSKQTLSDTSPLSPALASLNGALYLAWRGDGNDHLNVMVSTDNGQTFGNKLVAGDTSTQAPSLCVHNGNLFIAWKGDGNDNLNVALVTRNGTVPTGFSQKVTLGDQSPQSPSIASFNGRLYIAWKGDGNDQLNVMYSADNGHTFGHKLVAGDTSPQAPGLAVHNNNLYITWKGDGNDNLNVAIVAIAGDKITGLSQKVTLGDQSPQSPCLASMNGRLFIAWKGDGNDNLNLMYSTDNGRSFGNKFISQETSPKYPALAVNNGFLFYAWKGDGNDNLNVSVVGQAGPLITGFTTPAYRWQVNINSFAVQPGDTVACTVRYLSATAGTISFVNQTRAPNKPFNITLVPPPGASFRGNCAEWIMEAPDGGLPIAALPKFTDVKFSGAKCLNAANQPGDPKNADTFNVVFGGKTFTAVTLASDAVTVSFKG